jgi:hypothetical protein
MSRVISFSFVIGVNCAYFNLLPSGILLAWMRHRAPSIIVLLAHSETPFCSGVCGADVSNLIPLVDSHSLN